MKRISRRELIIQALVLLGLWLGIVALGAHQDDAGMTQALVWSLSFTRGYHFAWIFAFGLIVFYNFVVSAGSIIRGRIRGEINQLITRTTVQVVLLVSLLSASILVIQFSSKRRAEATFVQAIANRNDYRLLYPDDFAGFASADALEITSHGSDFLMITTRNGDRFMAVLDHHRKWIVVQQLEP